MKIETITSGPFATNSYLLFHDNSREALIIDAPWGLTEQLLQFDLADYAVNGIILTHGHWDHIAEAQQCSAAFSCPVWVHPLDEPYLNQTTRSAFGMKLPPIDRIESLSNLEPGPQQWGAFRFQVIHLPGHTPGHIGLFNEENAFLFPGDTLFAGSIGRTDLPGGDYDKLMKSIVEGLQKIPDRTNVFPGHGPATTMGIERATNPFILDYINSGHRS